MRCDICPAFVKHCPHNDDYNCGKTVELLEKENAELNKALKESENREKELCILAENLKLELKKLHKCSRCRSNEKDIDEMPCKNCLKDGVYTNWH